MSLVNGFNETRKLDALAQVFRAHSYDDKKVAVRFSLAAADLCKHLYKECGVISTLHTIFITVPENLLELINDDQNVCFLCFFLAQILQLIRTLPYSSQQFLIAPISANIALIHGSGQVLVGAVSRFADRDFPIAMLPWKSTQCR